MDEIDDFAGLMGDFYINVYYDETNNRYDEFEIYQIVNSVIPARCTDAVEITFMGELYFRTIYERHLPKILKQPLGPDKPVEGFHNCDVNDEHQIVHQLCIVANENWKRTLIHELTHAAVVEIMLVAHPAGLQQYIKFLDAFREHRRNDPFEYVAIACASPELADIQLNKEVNRVINRIRRFLNRLKHAICKFGGCSH
jgi:hypothetical protein